MNQCRLCQSDAELLESHIIPASGLPLAEENLVHWILAFWTAD